MHTCYISSGFDVFFFYGSPDDATSHYVGGNIQRNAPLLLIFEGNSYQVATRVLFPPFYFSTTSFHTTSQPRAFPITNTCHRREQVAVIFKPPKFHTNHSPCPVVHLPKQSAPSQGTTPPTRRHGGPMRRYRNSWRR